VNAAETALRSELAAAMRRRDTLAVSALRTALGALGNAEAVPAPASTPTTSSEHVAGAHVGLGATEAPRRELSDDEAWCIVRAEVDERVEAAAALEILGRAGQAASLHAEADTLLDVLRRTLGE
jgi:uncharacterized protein